MRTGDQQALIGVPVTGRVSFRDADGEIIDPGGTVTVNVTSGWDQFTPYQMAATPTPDGYTVAVTAVDAPDLVTLEWSNGSHTVVTTIEIVGGYYASIADIRGSRGDFIDDILSDASKYPTERLKAARRFVTEEFESFCGRAFVPRYATLTTTGDGYLVVPRPDVRAVRVLTVNGEDTPPPSPVDGTLVISGLPVGATVDIGYEHGLDRPPQQILRAFFTRVRASVNAIASAIPDRASTFASEGGATYSLLTEGRGGSLTAIPSVDVALRTWAYRQAVIG